MADKEDDNSHQERAQLSEDTERLKRALFQAVEAEFAAENASELNDEVGRPPSPVAGTSSQNDYDQEGVISSIDFDQLKAADVSEGLPVNLDACLMLNLAYQEILTDTLNQIQTALDYNREKQTLCRILMEESAQSKQTKKGANRAAYVKYSNPFFKDKDGMTPPFNVDTLAKQQTNERNQFLRARRPVRPNEVHKLAEAVKCQVLQKMMQPLMNRKEIWVERFEKLDSASEPAEELKTKIEEVDRNIQEISSMPDHDIFEKSQSMIDEIDWVVVSTSAFEGSVPEQHLKMSWLNVHNPIIKKTKWTKSEDEELLKLATENEEKNWQAVAESLETGRTPIQCLQRYMTELNPALKSGKWSKEESNLLLEVVENCMFEGHVSWVDVAENMDGRTPDQCKKQCDVINEFKDGHQHKWTHEEDQQLVVLVGKFGVNRFQKVALHLVGRNAEQCRERYWNHLDSSLNFENFSYSEDRLIWKYSTECEQSGEKPKWARLARMLSGRTDTRIRKRYVSMKLWKSHWDYFLSFPESIQEFIKVLQSECKKKKWRNSVKQENAETEISWNLSTEETLLYEADMNDGFWVPMPFTYIECSAVVRVIGRLAETYRRLVQMVHQMIVKENVNLTIEEISEVIGVILGSKHEHPMSKKRMLYNKLMTLNSALRIRPLREIAADVKMFILGGLKPKRRRKQRTLDDQIEYMIANKFLSKKTPSVKSATTIPKIGLPAEDQKTNYESLILGLFTKALNVDIEKAVGLADRQNLDRDTKGPRTKDKKNMEQIAVDSLLKVIQSDRVSAAMEKFPSLRDKLKKYAKKQQDVDKNNAQTQDDGQDSQATVSSSTQPNGLSVESDQLSADGNLTVTEDPLKPTTEASTNSAMYKMPPLPPTLSSLNAFRSLLLDRPNLITTAGGLYSAQNSDNDEEDNGKTLDEINLEKRRRRMKPSQSLHDFQMFRNRFMAMFIWPALLSSIEMPQEDEKEAESNNSDQEQRRNEERKAIENSNIPDSFKERILQGGPIILGKNRTGKNHNLKRGYLRGKRQRKRSVMSREKKIQFLKKVYDRKAKKNDSAAAVGSLLDTSDNTGNSSQESEVPHENLNDEVPPGGVETITRREVTTETESAQEETANQRQTDSEMKNTSVTKPTRRKRVWPVAEEGRRTSTRVSKRSQRFDGGFTTNTSQSPKKAKTTQE